MPIKKFNWNDISGSADFVGGSALIVNIIVIDIIALSSADNNRPRRRSHRSRAAINFPIRAYSLLITTLKTMYVICINTK